MHVLQLLPHLEVGGVERGVLDLAKGLIQQGHRVSVVSAGGALVETLTALGAMHYTMPLHRKSPASIWQYIPALCQLVQELSIDLIHARSRVPAWVGYLVARRTQRPFVTTCHGFYTPHPASWVMTWGHPVIVPSKILGRYLIDRFHVPPERLRVIPRGTDLSQFPFRSGPLRASPPWRIGVVGRITPLKGHDIAIRAVQQLMQQGVSVTLCLIGDAPPERPHLRRRLEELAASLGVEGAVEWLGTRPDIPEILASLDLLIAPSTYPESFGRSLIEAQAVGVPVVASRLGAFIELIEDRVTGLLVQPRHPTELANAITRLLRDPGLRERMAQQARRRVERHFTLERMVESTLAVYRDGVAKPKIVVWKLSAVGDVVLATPSLRAIRRHFRHSHITLVVGRPVYEVVAGCPYVDEILVYDVQRKDRTWRGKLRFLRSLIRAGFDLSIDLQNSRLTHLLAYLAGIRTRIGYARRWGNLLNRAVPLPRGPMDPVSHQHYLLKAAGVTPDGEALELWPSAWHEQQADRLLRQLGIDPLKPLVGIHPGGSDRWKTKRWDLERWAALCDRLSAKGIQVIVTGTAAEQGLGERLAALSQSHPQLAVGNTTLMELAALIRRCQAFVAHDSAPLHMATAVGVPTVALFGPTDPARHVPPSPLVRVINKRVFCSPCYSTWCRTITHACMKGISVDEVLQAIADCTRLPRGDRGGQGLRIADVESINPTSPIRNPKFV